MSSTDQDQTRQYLVLVNDEEQHSLWPAGKSIPAGWRDIGVYGTKSDCLEHVEKVWTDITPLSVRKRLAEGRA